MEICAWSYLISMPLYHSLYSFTIKVNDASQIDENLLTQMIKKTVHRILICLRDARWSMFQLKVISLNWQTWRLRRIIQCSRLDCEQREKRGKKPGRLYGHTILTCLFADALISWGSIGQHQQRLPVPLESKGSMSLGIRYRYTCLKRMAKTFQTGA